MPRNRTIRTNTTLADREAIERSARKAKEAEDAADADRDHVNSDDDNAAPLGMGNRDELLEEEKRRVEAKKAAAAREAARLKDSTGLLPRSSVSLRLVFYVFTNICCFSGQIQGVDVLVLRLLVPLL